MKRLQLHNLRCFIKHNPGATVSDFGRDRREIKEQIKATGAAYASSRSTK